MGINGAERLPFPFLPAEGGLLFPSLFLQEHLGCRAQSRSDKLKLSFNIMAFNPHVHCKHLFITLLFQSLFKQEATFSARAKLNIFSHLDRKSFETGRF